jgi:hypothetical protein
MREFPYLASRGGVRLDIGRVTPEKLIVDVEFVRTALDFDRDRHEKVPLVGGRKDAQIFDVILLSDELLFHLQTYIAEIFLDWDQSNFFCHVGHFVVSSARSERTEIEQLKEASKGSCRL